MQRDNTKTHWLQNPNKNYLGHWDLPEGNDVVLTIKSAQWEEVKNPITQTSEAKRVIRFKEDYKPFICNETNAQLILKSTKRNYMEDCVGMKVKLFLSQVKVMGQNVDCLRVRDIPQSEMQDKLINSEQCEELLNLINDTDMSSADICKLMKIDSISNLPAKMYKKLKDRLIQKAKENANN